MLQIKMNCNKRLVPGHQSLLLSLLQLSLLSEFLSRLFQCTFMYKLNSHATTQTAIGSHKT